MFNLNADLEQRRIKRLEELKAPIREKKGELTETDLKAIVSLISAEEEDTELRERIRASYTEIEGITAEIQLKTDTYNKLEVSLPDSPKLSKRAMIVMTVSCVGPFVGLSWMLTAALGWNKVAAYILTALVTSTTYISAGVSLHNAAINDIGTKGTRYEEKTFRIPAVLLLCLDAGVSVATIWIGATVDNDTLDFASVITILGIPTVSFLLTSLGIALTWYDAKSPESKGNARMFAAGQDRKVNDTRLREEFQKRDLSKVSIADLKKRLAAASKKHDKIQEQLSSSNKKREEATLAFQIALEVQKPSLPQQEQTPDVVFAEIVTEEEK